MENPETQGTLGKQDTGRRQIKHQNTTQKNKKIKKMSNTDPIRTRCEAKFLPLIAISDHLYDIKFKPVVSKNSLFRKYDPLFVSEIFNR
jgi:hypothetical protein